MAIKKAWTIKGASFPNCHHRIKQVTVHDNGELSVILARYADLSAKQASAELNGLEMTGFNEIPFNKGGSQNPHTVAYAHIMALPEYDGAEVE